MYIKSACRTHVVHVLAFGTSRNSIFPLSPPLARTLGSSSFVSTSTSRSTITGVLPRHRADLRSLSSLSCLPSPCYLSTFLPPRALVPLGLRTLVSNVSFATRLSSQDQQVQLQHQILSLPHRTTALPNSHTRRLVPSRLQYAILSRTACCLLYVLANADATPTVVVGKAEFPRRPRLT